MKNATVGIISLVMSGFPLMATPAFADADDAAWIKRCVSDNADQKQTAEVVAVYCACMTGKMSTSETQSVTAWEKSHPTEQEACSKQSNWVGK